MKVIQLMARFNKGGTANWLGSLVILLRESGHEVDLYCGYVSDKEEEDLNFHKLQGRRIENLSRNPSPIRDIKALLEIRKILLESKFDVLATHTAKAGFLGRIAAMSIRKRKFIVVHTYHGHLLYGYFNKTFTWIIRIIEKILSKHTDSIITSGLRVRQELLESGIGSPNKMIPINPTISPLTRIPKTEIRNRFEIDPDVIVVGWLGRMVEIKRPDRLVYLAKLFPEVVFLIGGEGELLGRTQSSAPRNCKFVGWIKPDEIWSASDIALLTSENEAIPLALVEAASLGLPLIAESVGSVSEIVKDKISGILVSGMDQRIAALKQLTSDANLRTTLGTAGSNLIREEFSADQFLKRHIQAYKVNY